MQLLHHLVPRKLLANGFHYRLYVIIRQSSLTRSRFVVKVSHSPEVSYNNFPWPGVGVSVNVAPRCS